MLVERLKGTSDDRVHVFVLGPSYGESILVKVPLKRWILIDSFLSEQKGSSICPVLELIERSGISLSCAVLTHAHEDHCGGWAHIVSKVKIEKLACVDVRATFFKPKKNKKGKGQKKETSKTAAQNPELVFKGKLKQGAVLATLNKWESEPSTKVLLDNDLELEIGECKFKCLYPSAKAIKKYKEMDRKKDNAIASPFELHWKDLVLLFGSDLENSGWAEVTASKFRHKFLGYKLAHHGSVGAVNEKLMALQHSDGVFFGTPWALGSSKLPNFESGNGPHRLLKHSKALFYSSIPYIVDLTSTKGRFQRAQLQSATRRAKVSDEIYISETDYSTDANRAEESWIHLEFGPDGKCHSIHRGPMAVEIYE